MTQAFALKFDSHLSTGTFGNGRALARNMELLYTGLLNILRQRIDCNLPPPHTVSDLSKRSIIRRTVDMAFAALSAGNAPGARDVLQAFETINRSSIGAIQAVVGPLTVFTNLNADEGAATIMASFIQSMRQEGISVKATTVGPPELSKVGSAVKLLEGIIPRITANTLDLAPGLMIVESSVKSAYINENPYCYMASKSQFRDEALLAETILHEALHQKMVDIRLSTNLLTDGYDDLTSEERGDILIPWPNQAAPRLWSAARALAAHHVYVHIVVLYRAILDAATELSAELIAHRLRIAFERARYLAHALRELRPSPWGDDGIEMLDWLDHPIDDVHEHASLRRSSTVLEGWQLAIKARREVQQA